MSDSLNLCRICLQPEGADKYHPIQSDNSKIAIQIYQISGVQVKGSLSMICEQCILDLNSAVDVRNKCLQADDFFRSIITERNFNRLDENAEDQLNCAIKDEPLDEYDNLDIFKPEVEFNTDSDGPKPSKVKKPKKRSQNPKEPFKLTSSSTSLQHERIQVDVDTSTFLNSSSVECPTCYKPFATLAYLKKHQRDQHSFRQKVSCSKCSKSLCDAYALVRHERRKHSGIEKPREKTLECDLCPYRTSVKDLLRRHISGSHTTRERVICRICGKIVTNKANLKAHERTHFDVDPSDYVPCPVCQKTFKYKSLMVEHKKVVHDRLKTLQCPSCPHISSCKASYDKHIKAVHLQLRDHICSECGKGFCRNGELVTHMRVHTGEKPYECSKCGLNGILKNFASNTQLKRHEKRSCPYRMT